MNALALRPGNPMVRVMPMILLFEVVVFGLALPGMVYVSHLSSTTAALACGGAAVLAILAAALIRRGTVGWLLGWLTQVAAVLLGFLVSMMFAAGGLFAAIWVMSFVLGRRIENGDVNGPAA